MLQSFSNRQGSCLGVLAFLVACVIMLPKQSVVYDLLCTIQLGPNAGLRTLPELSLLAILVPSYMRTPTTHPAQRASDGATQQQAPGGPYLSSAR